MVAQWLGPRSWRTLLVSLRPDRATDWGAPSEGNRIFGFAGTSGHLPAGLMRHPVMMSAQQGKIFDVGRSAGIPVVDVVGVAPGAGSAAAGEHAASVADCQGSALVSAGVAEFAAHAEWVTAG